MGEGVIVRPAKLLKAIVLVIGLAMALSFLGGSAAAARSSVTRVWIIADGPICELFPEECPAIAMAGNGDTLTVQGSGTLTPSPKSADGGGTFIHKNPDGEVLAEGTWTVTGLISFKSYGTTDLGGGVIGEGGLALVNVHGVSTTGLEFDGVLRIDCLLGTPPAGADEGFRLVVQTFDLNFNIEEHGATLFLPSD